MGTRKLMDKIKTELLENKIKIGRDALFTLLRNHGMLIKKNKCYHITTDSKHFYYTSPNLLKETELKHAEQAVVCDITYIKTDEGHAYLSLVTDPYTGKLITKKTETLEPEKAKDADIKRQGVVKGTSSEDVYTKDGKVDESKITEKVWKNKWNTKEEAIKFFEEHKDDIHRDKLIPKEIDTEYKRWKFSDGTKFNSKEEYDNAIKFGHKLELNTQITGSKHLTAKNITDADNANLQSAMTKLNIDSLDLDNPDSIRALQKALGMKSSDIAAGKFGQKTLLAIKKYLENNK